MIPTNKMDIILTYQSFRQKIDIPRMLELFHDDFHAQLGKEEIYKDDLSEIYLRVFLKYPDMEFQNVQNCFYKRKKNKDYIFSNYVQHSEKSKINRLVCETWTIFENKIINHEVLNMNLELTDNNFIDFFQQRDKQLTENMFAILSHAKLYEQFGGNAMKIDFNKAFTLKLLEFTNRITKDYISINLKEKICGHYLFLEDLYLRFPNHLWIGLFSTVTFDVCKMEGILLDRKWVGEFYGYDKIISVENPRKIKSLLEMIPISREKNRFFVCLKQFGFLSFEIFKYFLNLMKEGDLFCFNTSHNQKSLTTKNYFTEICDYLKSKNEYESLILKVFTTSAGWCDYHSFINDTEISSDFFVLKKIK